MRNLRLEFIFCIIGALMVSGCAASHQYMKQQDTERIYTVSYDELFSRAENVVKDARMVLIEVRKEEGIIDVVAPPSFWTSSLGNLLQGGDKVTVEVSRVDESHTKVRITSISRGDLIDLGRSARVVSTLFGSFDKNFAR